MRVCKLNNESSLSEARQLLALSRFVSNDVVLSAEVTVERCSTAVRDISAFMTKPFSAKPANTRLPSQGLH